ncbi:ASCH domain-containing protein [Salmonella enterica]
MAQITFHPDFIDAFASGQKTTTLRPTDFYCHRSDGMPECDIPPVWFHSERLEDYASFLHEASGRKAMLPQGTRIIWYTGFSDLQKRAPYQPSDPVELVAKDDNGGIIPFATATINDVSVIQWDDITEQHAINDGFVPSMGYSAIGRFFAFMQSVYPNLSPYQDAFWLYTFTDIRMLPQWRNEA